MEMKDIIRRIVVNCFLIIGGSTVCATVFSAVFAPEYAFDTKAMCSILLMGFLSSLTILLLRSKNELTKKSLMFRKALQCILVFFIIFFIAYHNDWIRRDSVIEPLIMFLLIAVYYAFVYLINYISGQKTAEEMNERLRKMHEKE